MIDAPPEDEKPPEGDIEADEPDDLDDDEDVDMALQQARFGLDRLKVAIRFVQDEVPPYGIENSEHGRSPANDNIVPPSIDLCRRRAVIAAYGLIEREFSQQPEADREDD